MRLVTPFLFLERYDDYDDNDGDDKDDINDDYDNLIKREWVTNLSEISLVVRICACFGPNGRDILDNYKSMAYGHRESDP